MATDRVAPAARWSRAPGGLFWKVFAACWLCAMLTGLGIHAFALLFPRLVDLPPHPPSVEQTVLMPVLTGGLMAMLLSGVLAWSLSRPIRLLHQAFGDAAAGRLDTRVTPRLGRQRDEFADLGRDYDRMAQQLQALLVSQRRLLHDVSHELRSPLARLQVAVGLVRRLPSGDAAGIAQALDRIEREVLRLDSLVSEVLTLARLSAGPSTAAWGDVDVVELLAAAVDDAAFEARGSGRDVVFDQDLPGLVMPADGELLHRAFDNVLRNAVKFSPAGGRVEVLAAFDAARSQLQVSVLDRGPGLPPEALASVFEPFVRHQPDPALPGFGLGLAIARQAAECHGGRLSAHARAGGGLRLMFELPLPARAAACCACGDARP